MQNIVVNDTNVFIDLLNVGLLDYIFQISWRVHTTDLVMFELSREGQRGVVGVYLNNGQLHVASFEMDELCEIRGLQNMIENRTAVSLTDCSSWYYARREGYILLTGDEKLRTLSMNDGVEVCGILGVLDKLVDEAVLTRADAVDKLKRLRLIKSRFPKDEIEKRICLWEDTSKKKGGG
jgi:predicted nucleic acid-binding protein